VTDWPLALGLGGRGVPARSRDTLAPEAAVWGALCEATRVSSPFSAARSGLERPRRGRADDSFILLIHTAAYWLMHTLRGLAPKASFWRDAQFDTVRLSLIKVAVRVTELVTRIKISLPTGFAYQHGFATLAARLAKLPP
jgi:hypothetical protein